MHAHIINDNTQKFQALNALFSSYACLHK
jgi:hypothetical protein